MAKIKGTVKVVGDGKFSKFVMLEERDGFYLNTKFDPKCGVGDVVGIVYTPKGDTRGNITKLTVLTDSGSPKGVQAREEKSGGGGDGSYAGRQDSIVYQSSRKDALVFLALLVEQGAIKLAGAKAEPKREQLEEYLDEITATFFKAASDPTNSPALKNAAEIDEDLKEPEGEEWESEEGPTDEWED